MIFEINKASDWSFKENVEINTMEDLMNLAKKYADKKEGETYTKLIIDFDGFTYGTGRPFVTVYDDYVE
jgi:maltose-binding protein MalE